MIRYFGKDEHLRWKTKTKTKAKRKEKDVRSQFIKEERLRWATKIKAERKENGMINQDIKIVQKAAKEHERQRWIKKLRELKKATDCYKNQDVIRYLRMIIISMETNKNFCKGM
jgi:hypothetical protein